MPIPTRRAGEEQDAFVSRCMSNKTMLREYPDQEQRAAICYRQARAKEWTKEANIVKSDTERQVAYAVVWEPDVPDISADHDMATADEVENMAHSFMAHYAKQEDTSGTHHRWRVERDRMYVVESYLAPTDFEIGEQRVTKGSWVMAVKIMDPELWTAVKSGQLSGFSLEGIGERVPV